MEVQSNDRYKSFDSSKDQMNVPMQSLSIPSPDPAGARAAQAKYDSGNPLLIDQNHRSDDQSSTGTAHVAASKAPKHNASRGFKAVTATSSTNSGIADKFEQSG